MVNLMDKTGKGWENMIYAYPEYYDEFKCIAGECRHSCCIGWEIDIDEETAEKYRRVEGELGARMVSCIDWQAAPPHFILGEGERCPFLNGDNLCDIILRLGEESISRICTDHPRFRTFLSQRGETGLGLCCEEAARIILSREVPFEVLEEGEGEYDADEDTLMDIREAAFDIVNGADTVTEAMERLLELCGAEMPDRTLADWARFYLELERLDGAWTTCLEQLAEADIDEEALLSFMESHGRECRNLLNYFLFRHFFIALDDGDIASKAAFAVLSTRMIMALGLSLGGEIAEWARMYSSEIEYSDENLDAVFDELC